MEVFNLAQQKHRVGVLCTCGHYMKGLFYYTASGLMKVDNLFICSACGRVVKTTQCEVD